ncbi:MAG: hypothetical protein NW223_14730 [Hyphomicrobiaceae bacterium]|nr:hypothetical protein [Hyphomicrobiaceae bacterium]
MARLNRKIWIGIGAATIAAVGGAGGAQSQHAHGGGTSARPEAAAPSPAAPKAAATAAEGGEAYLTDGGPTDTRIRFYRDVELVRGHLAVGRELVALGLWDEALPHFLHPTEELYDGLEKYIKLHSLQPFKRELLALAQAVKARKEGATQQAAKVLEPKLEAAIAAVKRFMNPPAGFMMRTAAELLKVAQSEYATAIENGRFVKPVEYQDGRGFMQQAEKLLAQAGPLVKAKDPGALARIELKFAEVRKAWPAPLPPDAPPIDPGALSALVSDIELHVSRF